MVKKAYSINKLNIYSGRVITYADYMIDEMKKGNSPSVRDVSKYFKQSSNPDLAKSHVTIYKSLVELLPSIDYDKYILVRILLDKNKAKGIEDTKVRVRVLSAVNLLLKDYTIDEIVEEMNKDVDKDELVTRDTIYRDITCRFPELAKKEDLSDLLIVLDEKLREHSLNNLANQNGNVPFSDCSNQNRDSQGRFKK